MNSSSWNSYGKIAPELETLLPHLPESRKNRSFADFPDVPTLRATILGEIAQAQDAGLIKPVDFTGVNKADLRIPTRDGSSIRAVHYRPKEAEASPVFVYYHGGGWAFGMPEAWESNFEILTKELGVVVISVEYRKAPEKLFPTSAHDAWDSLKWVAANASHLGADPTKGFIVGGSSAGGNIAAVASHEAADAKMSPPLTGVLLSIPVLVHPEALPERFKEHYHSWEQNKNAMILDQRGMNWAFQQSKFDPQSHLASPLNWPSGHKTQPPTYFQICGMDPLRDDSLIYEYILREECKVPTKMAMYSGLPHAAIDFLPMLPQAQKARDDLKEGFQWLLDHER